MVAPPTTPRSFAVDVARASAAFQELARQMGAQFLDKQEIIRLMTVSAIAGEHMVIVGPPGTAKSAMIDMFAKLIDARYFEYLLTRFTEPNELFGPVDISAFREGRYTRRLENMLPTAEIVFLDEIFKSNSAILNALLHVINERKFQNGPEVVTVPLISLYAASNEVPNDDNLAAMFDRFLVRVLSDNLDSYHFHELMKKGVSLELRKMTGRGVDAQGQRTQELRPITSSRELRQIQQNFDKFMIFPEEFLTKYKGLIFQIRSEGISVSDRRAVKLMKLFAASAVFDGRTKVHDGDFFILRHIWNNLDQVELIARRSAHRAWPHSRAADERHRAVRHPAVQPAQEPQRDQGRVVGAARRCGAAHDPRGRPAARDRVRVVEVRSLAPLDRHDDRAMVGRTGIESFCITCG